MESEDSVVTAGTVLFKISTSSSMPPLSKAFRISPTPALGIHLNSASVALPRCDVKSSRSWRYMYLRTCRTSKKTGAILFRRSVQVSLLDEKTRSDETEDAWAGRTSSAVRHR